MELGEEEGVKDSEENGGKFREVRRLGREDWVG